MMTFVASHSSVVTSEISDGGCSVSAEGDVYAGNEGHLYEISDGENEIPDAPEPLQDKRDHLTFRQDPVSNKDLEKLWHLRLGHVTPLKAVNHHFREGLFSHISCEEVDFEPCAKVKYRQEYSRLLTKSTKPGVFHFDTKRKFSTPSL